MEFTNHFIEELVSKVNLTEKEKCPRTHILNCGECVDIINCPYERKLALKQNEIREKLYKVFGLESR